MNTIRTLRLSLPINGISKNFYFTVLLILVNHLAVGQDEKYVLSDKTYNAGLSTSGPVIQFGRLSKSGYYGEVLVEIHAYTFQNSETTVNNSAIGGAYIAFDYFTNMSSDKPLKFHFGLGYGVYKEKSGKNSGYDLTGDIKVIDLHIGGRYYFTERIFTGLMIGVPLSTDRSNSILTQINSTLTTTLIPGLLMFGYRL